MLMKYFHVWMLCLIMIMASAVAAETKANQEATTRTILALEGDPKTELMGNDLWDAFPAPEVEASVAVFPFFEDDRATTLALELGFHTNYQIQIYSAPELVVWDYDLEMGQLGEMSDYDPVAFRRDDRHIATLSKYSGATHVLTGSLTRSEDVWRVDAALITPDETLHRVCEAPAYHDLELAGKLSRFVMENLPVADRDERLKNFDFGYLGSGYPSSTHVNGKVYPYERRLNAYIESIRGRNASNVLNEESTLGELLHYERYYAPTPFNLYADKDHLRYPVIYRIHAISMTWMHQEGSANQHRSGVARHPGDMEYARYLRNTVWPKGPYTDYFLIDMRRWYERAPKTSASDVLFAKALSQASWAYRGSGYADSVTEEGWKKFRELNQEVIDLLEKAKKESGPLPALSIELFSAYANTGDLENAKKVHADCVEAYPDYLQIWLDLLHYSRPRWYGSDEISMAIIDDAMARRPKNARMGRLAFYYHWSEAQVQFGDDSEEIEDKKAAFLVYLEEYPDRLDQVAEGMRRVTAYGDRTSHAFALTVLLLMDDDELALSILKKTPDYYLEERDSFPLNLKWYTIYRGLTLGFRSGGAWESVEGAAGDALENIELKRVGKPRYKLIPFTKNTLTGLRLLGRIMQNPSDQETIREIRIYILSAQDSGIAAILGTALILNDFPLAKDELLAAEWKSHVDAFAQEFKSGADPAYMRALNLLRLGQPEAAELEMQSVSEEQILLFEWLKDAWERARRESAVKGQRSI